MTASALPAPAAPRDATLPAPVERVLDNGLRVVAFSQRNLPLIAAQLVVRGGSAAEHEDEAGLSALVAVLLTQGTTARDASVMRAGTRRRCGSPGADTFVRRERLRRP